jgi:hypothetical protein
MPSDVTDEPPGQITADTDSKQRHTDSEWAHVDGKQVHVDGKQVHADSEQAYMDGKPMLSRQTWMVNYCCYHS